MSKSLYLTYAEPLSGVYTSQVIDVINYFNNNLDSDIQLVAFISIHDFNNQKTAIKKQMPDSLVLPMLPKAEFWKFNILFLFFVCLLKQPKAIIARNVIAANMALRIKSITPVKQVVFDGRGAIAAEWSEYDVSVVDSWKKSIHTLENDAVNKSDYRIAVSTKLVDYWKQRYNYNNTNHVVIPCTLSSSFIADNISNEEVIAIRKNLILEEDDLVLAYSGSIAGWQSFNGLSEFLIKFLNQSKKNKVIFLAPEEKNIEELMMKFPNQVTRKWVKHHEVVQILKSSDYGILFREQSITNQVASPTKFAEYLSAGLPVIISENLGDYSDLVKQENCGFVMNNNSEWPKLIANSSLQRNKMLEIVNKHYTKQAHKNSYQKILNSIVAN